MEAAAGRGELGTINGARTELRVGGKLRGSARECAEPVSLWENLSGRKTEGF